MQSIDFYGDAKKVFDNIRKENEYESQIRADERKKFAEWIDKRYGIIIPSSFKGDDGYRTISPEELLKQREIFNFD